MEHTHLNTIETLSPCDHNTRQDQDREYIVSTWTHRQTYTKNLYKVNKNANFLTWPGLNNQQLLKHLPPKIATTVGHLDQE